MTPARPVFMRMVTDSAGGSVSAIDKPIHAAERESEARRSRAHRAWRRAEFALLFVAAPAMIAIFRRDLGTALIPILLLFAALALTLLLTDRTFDRRTLWNAHTVRRVLPWIVGAFAAGAAMLTLGVLLFLPERLLAFPRNSPEMWMIVMLLYPLLSVYPQELIYRAFFFHRYAALFPSSVATVSASALAFGWMHIVFQNAVAVGLSALGGALFAWTYHRTRSVVAASVEHALYGCFVFTVGLGWFFYGGATH